MYANRTHQVVTLNNDMWIISTPNPTVSFINVSTQPKLSFNADYKNVLVKIEFGRSFDGYCASISVRMGLCRTVKLRAKAGVRSRVFFDTLLHSSNSGVHCMTSLRMRIIYYGKYGATLTHDCSSYRLC